MKRVLFLTRYNVLSLFHSIVVLYVGTKRVVELREWDKLDCTMKKFVCGVRPLKGLYLLPNIEKEEGMDHMLNIDTNGKEFITFIFIFDFLSFCFNALVWDIKSVFNNLKY